MRVAATRAWTVAASASSTGYTTATSSGRLTVILRRAEEASPGDALTSASASRVAQSIAVVHGILQCAICLWLIELEWSGSLEEAHAGVVLVMGCFPEVAIVVISKIVYARLL
jgi:hypothetical protein